MSFRVWSDLLFQQNNKSVSLGSAQSTNSWQLSWSSTLSSRRRSNWQKKGWLTENWLQWESVVGKVWFWSWKDCEGKLIQEYKRASQEVDWGWCLCIKSHRARTSSGRILYSWKWDNIRSESHLSQGKKKLQTGPQSSFRKQDPIVWRKSGEAHDSKCLQSSWKFSQLLIIWDKFSSAGFDPLSFIKSTQPGWLYSKKNTYCIPLLTGFMMRCSFLFTEGLRTCPEHKNNCQMISWPRLTKYWSKKILSTDWMKWKLLLISSNSTIPLKVKPIKVRWISWINTTPLLLSLPESGTFFPPFVNP